jgi:hypothetical protein
MRSARQAPSAVSVAGLYVFGLVLFCWPFLDLVTNALPILPGELQWRYGFAGLMAAYLHTPILALVMVTASAYALGHTKTLRALSAFEVVMAFGIVLIAVGFSLDLLQVRASRPEEVRGAVMAGGLIAVAKHLSSAAVLLLLGIGGWRTAKVASSQATTVDKAAEAGIVMRKRGS